MSTERSPEEPPPLPQGLKVGEWCVGARAGKGTYGVVYRTHRVGQEGAGPVALKLAVYPWDPRFAREAELLSRIRHDSIPRLLGHGVLRHSSGAEHPYLVMEWIEGTPLYDWAEEHAPSSRQLCQPLAQLARALETIHAAQAVHRDVKGANVLVRHSDGRAMLIDFGSGYFQGASRLTWQSLAPGTSAYQAPAACRFLIRSVRDRDAYYEASPADDVFALGVTAYRLVMGAYPPPMEPDANEVGAWRLKDSELRLALEGNPRVAPPLRELILRMLSAAPEARGSAAELARELEAMAAEVEPSKAEAPAGRSMRPERSRPGARGRSWKPWVALAAVGMCGGLLGALHWGLAQLGHLSASRQGTSDVEAPDAGTAAVGDTAPTVAPASVHPPAERKPVAQPIPLEPRPGQTRPDAKGRCPGSTQVAINGGCWVQQPAMTAEACTENGYAYSKGQCYAPALAPSEKPLPTSSPATAH